MGSELVRGQDLEAFHQMAGHILPCRRADLTQISAGRQTIESHMFRARDVAMIRIRVTRDTVSSIDLRPEFVAVILPVHGDHWVNGVHLVPPRMYLAADFSGYFARGGPRDVISIGLNRRRLIETLAALDGCTPDEIGLVNTVIEIPLRSFFTLRQKCAALARQCATESNPEALPATFEIEESLFGAILDAYLAGSRCDPALRRPDTDRSAERIVRLAEDYFDAMQGERVSLADLCVAASVGRNVLYSAFRKLFDETPLNYFRKRRLHNARSALLAAHPETGTVKRIALDLGLTELGRFSVEYRRLFGESPSTTLRQSPETRSNAIDQTGTILRASNMTMLD